MAPLLRQKSGGQTEKVRPHKSGKHPVFSKLPRAKGIGTGAGTPAEGEAGLDQADPVYDSQDEANVCIQVEEVRLSHSLRNVPDKAKSYACEHYALAPSISLEAFRRKLENSINTYVASKTVDAAGEFLEDISSLDCSAFHDLLISDLLRLALDRDDDQRGLIAALISALKAGNVLTQAQVQRGFEKWVAGIDDLSVDVPAALSLLLKFIDGALSDGALPPSYSERLPEMFLDFGLEHWEEFPDLCQQLGALREYKKEAQAIARKWADGLENATERGGDLKVFRDEDLVGSLHLMQEKVKRSTGSRFLLRKGDKKLFQHEFIKILIVLSLDRGLTCQEHCSRFLGAAVGSTFSQEDAIFGFSRVVGNMEDLKKDTPKIAKILKTYLVRAVVDEVIPPGVLLSWRRLHQGGAEALQMLSEACQLLDNPSMDSYQIKNLWKTLRLEELDPPSCSSGAHPGSLSLGLPSLSVRSVASSSPQEGVGARRWRLVSSGQMRPSEDDKSFSKALDGALQELLEQDNFSEFGKWLSEWDVPLGSDRAADVVRKLFVKVMEKSPKDYKSNAKKAFKLLKRLLDLSTPPLLDRAAVDRGVEELLERLPDVELDVPGASQMVDFLVQGVKDEGLLPSPPVETSGERDAFNCKLKILRGGLSPRMMKSSKSSARKQRKYGGGFSSPSFRSCGWSCSPRALSELEPTSSSPFSRVDSPKTTRSACGRWPSPDLLPTKSEPADKVPARKSFYTILNCGEGGQSYM